MLTVLTKTHSLILPLSRAMSTMTWNKTTKLYWKQKLPADEAAKLMKESLKRETPTLPRLAQYCSLLHSHNKWLDIYETYPAIQQVSANSAIPLIFTALYQLENKSDYSFANSTLEKLEKRNLDAAESRSFSLLLGRMGRYREALKYLESYLKSKEHPADLAAHQEKMNLELASNLPQKALQSANQLLMIDPSRNAVRLSKVIALTNLERMNEALIQLSILIGSTTNPIFKASLYQYRAKCRPYEDLNEKILDLEMSCQIYPKGNQQTLLNLLYQTAMYDELEAMIEKIARTQSVEKDFNIAAMRANMYWIARNDDKKALQWYRYAYEAAPPSYKQQFKMRIEAIKRAMKNS